MEEKENSTVKEGSAGRLNSKEEDAGGSNPSENDSSHITQNIFVADTIEDDLSMMIPPSQDDSALMIPSTPALEDKSGNRSERTDPNESTLSVNETYIDLESNEQTKDSSKEDATAAACIENDMTQDLADLQPTQPIICSNLRVEHNLSEIRADDSRKNTDEDDDEWHLKFSETQTPELLNLERDNQNDEAPDSEPFTTPRRAAEKELEEENDEDLPATLSIEVPQRKDDDGDYYSSGFKRPAPLDDIEAADNESDDEIEPSQSCLSDYRGETISASYKVQPNTDSSFGDIPKLYSEKETRVEDNDNNDLEMKVLESENRTITLTDSEPKSIFNISKDAQEGKSIEEINLEGETNDEKEHTANDAEQQIKKDSEMKEEHPTEKKSSEYKGRTGTSVKVLEKDSVKGTAETNGNQVEIVKASHGAIESEILIDEQIDIKVQKKARGVEKKGKKSKASDTSITNSDEHDVEITGFRPKRRKEKSPNHIRVMKNDEENSVEIIELKDKKEKQTALETKVDSKSGDGEIIKDPDSSYLDSKEKKQSPLEEKLHVENESNDVTKAPAEIDSEHNKISVVAEKVQPITKQIAEDRSETPPNIFAFPSAPNRNFSSGRKQKGQNKNLFHEVPSTEKYEEIGSYKDKESLEMFLKNEHVSIDHEKIEVLFSKPCELEVRKVIILAENGAILLKESSIEIEHGHRDSGVSTTTSSSFPTTSSTTSSKISLHSGEMADLESLSGKSNSCGIRRETSHILLSQDTTVSEISPKTSTQKSPKPTEFPTFGKGGLDEKNIESKVSPIVPDKTKKSIPSKRKRAPKNAAPSSTDSATVSEPKNKKRKGKARAKARIVVADIKSDETEDSKEFFVEEKPRRPPKRRKAAAVVPDIKPEDIKEIIENMEMTTEEDSSEDANFGSIVPGVKVMARWKDGYYYSGTVQKQELDGKWAVLFEDGFLRTITLENLIKIAILTKGTSVLVQSADGYYDPGIVCGHFREGNKVGYEVELDNGVTQRYPRSSVILSTDQAKLIMSSRPPTTPSTLTINLDNIVDGKRKRKSVQSPTPVVTSPVSKRSPRVTRSKKPDSNLDSTADSSAPEVAPVVKDSETEGPSKKKRKGKSRAKKTSEASATTVSSIPSTSTASGSKSTSAISSSSRLTSTCISSIGKPPSTNAANSCKSTKVLPQRSAKKLFKDYAFLLTNADRRVVVVKQQFDTSDSDALKEEEDIVPFDKDELCSHIDSGGGIVLEKFDDIKKCSRKHIYLLANTYLRTMKYIQCIAAGISCIKHHWVQNCIFKGEILGLNSYILPSGFSIVTQEIIEWHGSTDVFKGCKIALVSAPEFGFVYTWAPVLLAAKADFVQKWSLPSSVSGCSLVVDVLITNIHCPSEIIQSAKRKKIPIVSSEWIIQCLISGKRVPYDAHQKFKYDYKEI